MSPAQEFSGKVVVVTGSARGIGRTTAEMFSDRGAAVVFSDIQDELGMDVAQSLKDRGRNAMYVSCNTAEESSVAQLMDRATTAFGRLDVLVNNAGVEGQIAPTLEYTSENFDRLVSVNLRGVWLCIKYAVKKMIEAKNGGAIVNLASLAGHVGFAGLGPYVMSKHGVVGLTKAVAIEYSNIGIRTNAVSPGCIQTQMIDNLADALGADSADEALAHLHPLGRLGTQEEVAESILWLASDRASNVTGTSLSVDGGFISQ